MLRDGHTEGLSRRELLQGMALGAVGTAGAGLLAACQAPAAQTTDKTDTGAAEQAATATTAQRSSPGQPATLPAREEASNFNVMPDSETKVGNTYENLMTALAGETAANAKYEAFAVAAEAAGFSQISRLFVCTADAEKIHIELEFRLASGMDEGTVKPKAPEIEPDSTDINLIIGAKGEIYETSDMYPAFIEVAIKEKETAAAQVFTRAKQAEAFHAQLYLDAYNTIDTPDDEHYYLCPVCGYIHKGDDFETCPICLTGKDRFSAY
ncbi:MAG: rubrerythrin family protein [Coriobacteriales bacterium]|nr:rubrerythrin family protein [Coriobacteriales bacterium]